MTGMIHQSDLYDVQINHKLASQVLDKLYVFKEPDGESFILVARASHRDKPYSSCVNGVNDSQIRSFVAEIISDTEWRIPAIGIPHEESYEIMNYVIEQIQEALEKV